MIGGLPHGATTLPTTRRVQRAPVSWRVRALSAVVGLWLVLGGILGVRHEGRVVHVLDARTGTFRHAEGIAPTTHRSTETTCRAAGAPTDGDLCAIATALHQAGQAGPTHPPPSRPALACAIVTTAPTIASATRATVYAFAPKTSPPLAG